MPLVIVVTHSWMSEGINQTVKYIMGEQENLYCISAYTDETMDFMDDVRKIIFQNNNQNCFILTDIFGGSVNTKLASFLSEFDHIHLITGVNLPMVIQLLLTNYDEAEDIVGKTIFEAKKGIIYMNERSQSIDEFDEF